MTRTSLWDGHLVLLYESEQEHDANLAGWMRRGLERGEKVVVTRLPGEPEGRMLRLCHEAGVDPVQARLAGRVESLLPAQFYSAQRQDELIARAFAEGFSGVRLNARASTALSLLSERGYLAAEHAMDRHCRNGSVSALCAYTRPAPSYQPLRETLATHYDGVRSVGFSSWRGEDGVLLCGEVDLVTADVLAAALDAAVGTIGTAEELVLDLSRLDFIDVAGFRTLMRATADFRAADGRLMLKRAQRPVARTLRLLDVDGAPGVRLVDGAS